MWGLIVDNVITDIIPNPKSVTINNVQYPSNSFSWSKSDLGNLGIYEIVQDNTNLKDSKYYINTSISYEFKSSVTIDSQSYSNVIVGSYGSATALPMNDILFVDGDEIPTGASVGDIKQFGLKSIHKDNINLQASSILSNTDWYAWRASEGGTAMPTNIKTYRASVRTKSNEMCTLIDNASDVDALIALYVYNDENPPVRPLGEFPTL